MRGRLRTRLFLWFGLAILAIGVAVMLLAAAWIALPQLAWLRARTALGRGDLPAARGVLKELENVHRGLIAMHLEKTLKSDRVLRDLRRV